MGKYINRLYSQIFTLTPRGFTLVELLIVIGVLGTLTTVLIIVIDPVKQLQKARDTDRKADIAQIQQAIELYRSDLGEYPPAFTNCGPTANLIAGSVTYMRSIPCDPTTGNSYQYLPTGTPRVSYSIYACLENDADRDKDSGTDSCSGPTVSYTRYNP